MYSIKQRGRPDLPALVDSGADASGLPLDIAKRLEISYDPADVRIAFGAGGAFAEHEADGDVLLRTEIGTVRLTRPTVNAALPFVLLGRRDFFDGRRVCFDQRAQSMEIESD